MTKIIAFFLPQFHEIPENNKWWGQGFTEWINTKKAKPLFKGHYQPREPLGDNYYNMLDKTTMHWQKDLAKQYGIHGFCYYHYWFNGKMLLEKPLEIILEDKSIDLPFCMCWANEPWTRAWDGGDKEVIMPQTYGKEEAWEKHFEYLVKFFMDDRYIKVENKPMFVLYRTSNITNCEDMISYWNSRCKDYGFNGIYIVEEVNSFQNNVCLEKSQGYLEFEPVYTLCHDLGLNGNLRVKTTGLLKKLRKNKAVIQKYDYDYVWKRIITRKREQNGKTPILGAFVDWDNTARKGSNGIVFENMTPEKFQFYLTKQLERCTEASSEFLFINAWNEWAEGTYLEPDKKYGYANLEAIKNAQQNK